MMASKKDGVLYVGIDPLAAISREKQLKKWRREWKVELIEANNAEWHDLYASIV
jgi:putative endonuclease